MPKKKKQQQKQKEGYEKEREFVSTEDFFISEQAMQVNNALWERRIPVAVSR